MPPLSTFVEEYKKIDGVAHYFGVMIFTKRHPHVIKMLADSVYWESLNDISGERFCIFSVEPELGKMVPPINRFRSNARTMGMMVQTWKEPQKNKELIKVFNIKETQKPLLLLFAEVDDSYIKFELEIDDSSIESAYNSTKNQIEFVTEILENVDETNLQNPYGLDAALTVKIKDRSKLETFKKVFDIYSFIKNLIP